MGDVIEVATLRVYRDARWHNRCDGRLPVVRTEVALDAPNDFDGFSGDQGRRGSKGHPITPTDGRIYGVEIEADGEPS